MRRLITAVLAAGLLLTGCSGTAPAHAHTAATPTPAAYSDAQACAAFHQATTTGAPGGQNTMTWLLKHDSQASPVLKAALMRFVNAWADPLNVKGIHRAHRALARLCG